MFIHAYVMSQLPQLHVSVVFDTDAAICRITNAAHHNPSLPLLFPYPTLPGAAKNMKAAAEWLLKAAEKRHLQVAIAPNPNPYLNPNRKYTPTLKQTGSCLLQQHVSATHFSSSSSLRNLSLTLPIILTLPLTLTLIITYQSLSSGSRKLCIEVRTEIG